MPQKHQPIERVSKFPSDLFHAQFVARAEISECIYFIKDSKRNIRLRPAIRFTETVRLLYLET